MDVINLPREYGKGLEVFKRVHIYAVPKTYFLKHNISLEEAGKGDFVKELFKEDLPEDAEVVEIWGEPRIDAVMYKFSHPSFQVARPCREILTFYSGRVK